MNGYTFIKIISVTFICSYLYNGGPLLKHVIQRWDICLTLLHSERPKLHTILAFLSAIGLKSYLKDWRRLDRACNPRVGSPAPYPLHCRCSEGILINLTDQQAEIKFHYLQTFTLLAFRHHIHWVNNNMKKDSICFPGTMMGFNIRTSKS